jgi:glycosyltransferase involved in cell wall biosynthesis
MRQSTHPAVADSLMSASALDPSKVQQQAQALEENEAWSDLFDYAQRQQPHCSDQPQLSGYLDYLAGRALLELEQSEQAEPLLRRACLALPEFPYAYQLLGRSLSDQKLWAPAAAAQERCIALKNDFGYAWMELGRAREELGATSAAIQAYIQAEKLLTNNDWLQCRLIHLQVHEALQAGDHKTAATRIVALQQQRSLPASQVLTWLEAAAALARCGRWPEAIQLAAAIRQGGEQAGRPSPLGTRAPLLLIAVGVLMEQNNRTLIQPRALAGALLETLWLPHNESENQFWVNTLADIVTAMSQCFTNGWSHHSKELVLLMLAVAQVAADHFNDHWRALTLLEQLALLPELSANERRVLDERCGLMALGAARPVEANRHLLRIPEQQRSSNTEAALCRAHLELAGRHLPLDLQQGQTTALQLLRQLARRPRKSQMRADLDQLLWKLNTRVLDDTNAMAHASGPIRAAQELRRNGLNLISALTTQSLNPPGLPPMPALQRPARRWLLLANASLPQCFLYRVEQKREQLESLDREVLIIDVETCNSWSVASALLWADRVVVCRLPGTYPVLRAMGLAQRMGIKVFYDIDDLIFDQEHFPPPLSSYGGTISASLHTGLAMDAPLFEAAMVKADALIVSTATLAKRWQELHPQSQQPLHVLANMAPPALRREFKAIQPKQHQAVASDQLRLVVSSGTLAHKQVWVEELAPALAAVLDKHPQLQLDLVGSIEWPQELQSVACERIRSLPFSDYPTYLRHVGRAHIGLAPLEPGIVTDAKSAIKWMEYSLMGLASVVSPTATYQEILKDGSDVLFASDRQGWVQALERLIHNPQLRSQLAVNAQQRADALFGQAQGQRFWQELDQSDCNSLPPCKRRKQLVINCFFAPQSVGGATRVAQNRVRELLDQDDAPEVTVLCVDLDPWQGLPTAGSMPLDVHTWHGARIIRLSVSAKPWDWHHDSEVEAFCREWFEREAFDAIEAHSMQIITAAPLKVAKAMGIPYTVVLHDGWWLSQLQFLTRDDGTAVDPIDPLSAIESDATDDIKNAARERRRDLFDLLEAAEERLAVSDTFADLHRRAGVRNMGVRTNTVARPEEQELQQRRQRRPDDPVRICMVGGMAVHKGYAVFRAAVQQAGLGNKAIVTVIDHRLDEGDPSYSLQWGGTPVRFCPSIPMTKMNCFYASQDVLVAPSIWPESFGLVTREALQLGLWVIASDIGALAQPIQDGVNGRKVEARSVEQLARALQETLQSSANRGTPAPQDNTPYHN